MPPSQAARPGGPPQSLLNQGTMGSWGNRGTGRGCLPSAASGPSTPTRRSQPADSSLGAPARQSSVPGLARPLPPESHASELSVLQPPLLPPSRAAGAPMETTGLHPAPPPAAAPLTTSALRQILSLTCKCIYDYHKWGAWRRGGSGRVGTGGGPPRETGPAQPRRAPPWAPSEGAVPWLGPRASGSPPAPGLSSGMRQV